MTQNCQINRRRTERFTLPPMYSSITARRAGDDRDQEMTGHAYDISESGIRIELDEPLEPGETISLQIDLPGSTKRVVASGEIVWVNDEDDDPGPRRMALEFTDFVSNQDRFRLVDFLGSGQVRRAA